MTPPVPPVASAPPRDALTIGPLAPAEARALAALREAAAWCDRSDRRRLMFTGDKAADVLGGLVTNDVVALAPEGGQYAAALTPKGKVIADLRVLRLAADRVLVDTGARAGDGLVAMIRKYVNPRLAMYRDISTVTRCVGVYGPEAVAVVQRVLDLESLTPSSALAALPAFHVQAWPVDDDWWILVRSPELGALGFDLIVPEAHWERVIDALDGVSQLSAAAYDVGRIDAGRPAWGVDMDESTIPQEARLEALGAISFEKGCYTGQEVVARLHFRGHVNRRLVQLRGAGVAPLTSGALVVLDDATTVGDVRSSAVLPDGGVVALAMVRREVADGATVQVDGVPVVVSSIGG